MTFGELKNEIRDLGFEEDSTMEETRDIVINACNRAIDFINTTIRPIVKCYMVELPEEVPETLVVDMAEVADFVDFFGKPKYKSGDKYVALSDMQMLTFSKFATKPEYAPLEVYYKARPTLLNETTADDFEIELEPLVQPLIALLASYYVWLDDDERKATMYYNQYDDMKNQILGNMANMRAVTFDGGVSWHR